MLRRTRRHPPRRAARTWSAPPRRAHPSTARASERAAATRVPTHHPCPRERCRAVGVKCTGKKAELVERLLAPHANQKKSAIKKTSTKKKDKHAPKKGKSSFLFFCEDNRDEVEYAHLSFAEKAKVPPLRLNHHLHRSQSARSGPASQALGDAWKELSDRERYKAKADEDRKRYEREIAEYVPPVRQAAWIRHGRALGSDLRVLCAPSRKCRVRAQVDDEEEATPAKTKKSKKTKQTAAASSPFAAPVSGLDLLAMADHAVLEQEIDDDGDAEIDLLPDVEAEPDRCACDHGVCPYDPSTEGFVCEALD